MRSAIAPGRWPNCGRRCGLPVNEPPPAAVYQTDCLSAIRAVDILGSLPSSPINAFIREGLMIRFLTAAAALAALLLAPVLRADDKKSRVEQFDELKQDFGKVASDIAKEWNAAKDDEGKK